MGWHGDCIAGACFMLTCVGTCKGWAKGLRWRVRQWCGIVSHGQGRGSVRS